MSLRLHFVCSSFPRPCFCFKEDLLYYCTVSITWFWTDLLSPHHIVPSHALFVRKRGSQKGFADHPRMNGSDGSKSTLNRVCQQRTIGKWLKDVKMSNQRLQGKNVTVTLFFFGSSSNFWILWEYKSTDTTQIQFSVTVQQKPFDLISLLKIKTIKDLVSGETVLQVNPSVHT